jgi:hypothetical protein
LSAGAIPKKDDFDIGLPPGDAVLAVKGANFLSNGDLTDIFLYFCFRKAELNVPV